MLLAWWSVWSEVQTCIRPSWCHCHSLSLASVKSRLFVCVCVCVCVQFCAWNKLLMSWTPIATDRPIHRCIHPIRSTDAALSLHASFPLRSDIVDFDLPWLRIYAHSVHSNKKLCYLRRTARRAMSVRNLVNCRNKSYNKSPTNRSNIELDGYRWPTCSKQPRLVDCRSWLVCIFFGHFSTFAPGFPILYFQSSH